MKISHTLGYLVVASMALLITLSFMKGAEDTAIANIKAEHYKCMNERTDHCAHIEAEYEKIKGDS